MTSRSTTRVPGWALGLAGVAVFLLLLQILPTAGVIDRRFFPPASEMFGALSSWLVAPQFWTALGQTLTTWITGLAIAFVAGSVLGILIGEIPGMRALTASTIEFLRPVPSVALVPLVVMLYGPTMQSTLILVVYASIWQVLLQVLAGVGSVDPVADDTARSYRFSLWTRVRTVTLPSALPYVMTGLRLAASVALILTLTGELLIGTPGLGSLLIDARASGQYPLIYALVLVAGALGLAVNLIFRQIERRTMFWHPSIRGEVAA
ncbi:ABC transporter permease [Antribacter gilvus]|uniref:ABC transporter permease n=1 Tax=Antribacter gilvus TaxID=2304675 RepID=UPI000F7BA68F|nr:ABC transporter permease [Antribacter gilvus]